MSDKPTLSEARAARAAARRRLTQSAAEAKTRLAPRRLVARGAATAKRQAIDAAASAGEAVRRRPGVAGTAILVAVAAVMGRPLLRRLRRSPPPAVTTTPAPSPATDIARTPHLEALPAAQNSHHDHAAALKGPVP